MTDGAEQNRRMLSQFRHRAVRQGLVRSQVTLSAQVVVRVVEFEREFLRCRVQDLDRLANDFRSGPVPADDCDVVALHESNSPSVPARSAGGGMLMIQRRLAMKF